MSQQIKELEDRVQQLEKELEQEKRYAQEQHEKRLLCLRKLLVEELKG